MQNLKVLHQNSNPAGPIKSPLADISNRRDHCVVGLGEAMQKQGIVRGIGLAALSVAAGAGSFIALGLRPDGIASYYRDTLTSAGFAVWFAGFLVATLAAPVVAIACWLGSMRFRHGWLLHLLLVPATYAAVRGSISIMLLAAGEPNSDGPTGWATDPAAMLMLICPLVSFVALCLTRLHRRRAIVADG